jgi:hypothetical protein
VLLRAAFRLVVVSAFATFGTQGFGWEFAQLLTLTAIFCGFVAAIRGEEVFGHTLTHWDEAAAYAIVGHVLRALA